MKAKTRYYCKECGNEALRWMGQCPACGSWDSFVEQPVKTSGKKRDNYAPIDRKKAELLSKLDADDEVRFSTGMNELDRVLGGGVVNGSLILVGGAPGIGKSTLMLQICGEIAKNNRVLYVSGEESVRQIKLRADRLGVGEGDIYILAETSIADILETVEEIDPEILIIDSIQTLYSEDNNSTPGSIGQVKECTSQLMRLAKDTGTTVFVIGHVNKEGAIAGPKVLEHMVDCVLYFEGMNSAPYRILRAAKNRFGSTNEIGVFEMLDRGLEQVENPSEVLLAGRPVNTPGTCVACVMEGTRPILAEVQALLTTSSYNLPRRNSNGIEFNRAMLLLAVLEKRGGLRVGGCDAYINVIGGLDLDETAADLAVVLAIASSWLNRPIDDDIVAFGEVGLSGELRAVNSTNQRLAEAARLGFKRCVIAQAQKNLTVPEGMEIIRVKNIITAIESVLGNN